MNAAKLSDPRTGSVVFFHRNSNPGINSHIVHYRCGAVNPEPVARTLARVSHASVVDRSRRCQRRASVATWWRLAAR
jgi:hypothetical protein